MTNFLNPFSIPENHVQYEMDNTMRPIMIDIGCGENKEEGYLGIDRYNGDYVDLVLDLETMKLPFKEDSVNHVVTYHCLEHLNNLKGLLDEIWRVLKPNSQFFVCVPYFHNYINIANPYHVQNFNEHSFRFFSTEKNTKALPDHLWKFNFTPTWGLKGSDNTDCKAEFRTLRIEFDYIQKYRGINAQELENIIYKQ
jgi:SAM-dependent methyltransferase